MDEYIDCPYCHAASPAAEFTAGFGHCPFCGAANHELDGYMGHLGQRTASGSLDDLTQRRALNLVREWMRQRYGDEDSKETMAPSGQHAYESGGGLKLHPSWTGTWQHPVTGEMVDDESGPSPAILHEGVPGWADDASFDDDLNDRLRGLGVQTGNWYGNVLTLHPHREWSIPPHARTSAVLFPPCPGCGQVKGFEPYPWARGMMWCNDRSCQHIVPAKELAHQFNDLMLQHDLDVSTLPETDHPTRGKHGRVAGRARTAAGMSWEETMKYIDDALAAGDQEPEHHPDGRRHWPTDWEARTAPLEELYDAYHDYDHSGFNEGPHVEHAWEELKRRHEEGEVDDPDREELADWYGTHATSDDDDHYTDRTGSTMNRTAAIDFVAAQNTRDRDELLFRAHRHASQLTCRLTVPEAQRAVRAFVAAVNREALRTAASPEDEACEDCGADAGEECRPYCTGKAKHDDEVAEGKRREGSRRTAAVVADFPDELMF